MSVQILSCPDNVSAHLSKAISHTVMVYIIQIVLLYSSHVFVQYVCIVCVSTCAVCVSTCAVCMNI